MFGFMKAPANKATKADQTDPFDSDDESNGKRQPADDDRYKNGFRDSGGLENQSVQELENYAMYKAEETTSGVNNCLRIAEDIKQDATKTLDMLHAQGDQINRTHQMAVDMDKDLSKVRSIYNFEFILHCPCLSGKF